MSKFFAFVLSVLFVVAAAAPLMAVDARQVGARQESMAFVGNYIEDSYNIFTWYATLPSYSNMVWFGMQDLYRGDSTSASIGYHLGASYGLGSEGKKGTIAIFFYDQSAGLNPFVGNPWDGGPGVFTAPLDNKVTLLYAYPMERMNFGIFFSRSDMSSKNDSALTTAHEYRYAYTTIGAGFRFDIGDKCYTDLAADVSVGSYKDNYNNYPGYGEVSADANKLYEVRGRMFYEWSDKITLVPFVSFGTFDFRFKADSTDFGNDYYGDKGMLFDVGLGANIKVNEDNLLVFALEPYSYSKREPSQPLTGTSRSITTTVVPRFFLALESDVKDWLTFRVGANKDLYKVERKHEVTGVKPDKITTTGADFNFYMGLGFHVAQFDIDALLNNQLPMHLGYWLTGYGSDAGNATNEPVYVLSATYHF